MSIVKEVKKKKDGRQRRATAWEHLSNDIGTSSSRHTDEQKALASIRKVEGLSDGSVTDSFSPLPISHSVPEVCSCLLLNREGGGQRLIPPADPSKDRRLGMSPHTGLSY